MTTRVVIEQDVLRNLILAQLDETMIGLPVPLTPTTAGTTTTIVDTQLVRGTKDTNMYDGRQIKVSKASAAAGATLGLVTAVTEGGLTLATGTLAINPALNAGIKTDQEFLMYPRSIAPETVLEMIQQPLRMWEAPTFKMFSLIKNADFELGTDGETGWTAIAGGTLVAGPTTSATDSPVFPGNLLAVSASASGDGVASPSFQVYTREEIIISVLVAPAASRTLTVTLYDATQSAAIKAVTVDVDATWSDVRFSQAVPTGCELCTIRVTQNGSGAFAIQAPVVAQSTWGRLMHLDRSLYREEQIIDGFSVPAGQSYATDVYVPYSRELRSGNYRSVRDDRLRAIAQSSLMQHGVSGTAESADFSSLMFQVKPKGIDDLIGLSYYRPFGEVAAETGFIGCDRDWLAWRATANVMRAIGDGRYTSWSRMADDRARALGYALRQVSVRENPVLMMT